MKCKTIEPDRTKQIDWPIVWVTLILLLFAAYISWGFFKVRKKNIKPVHIAVTLLTLLLAFLLLFLITLDIYPAHTYGEPFLLLEGVSVWPNLVIRFAGIMMILLFIYFFHPRREREIEAIEHNFGLCKTTCLRSCREAVLQGPFLNLCAAKRRHIAYL